MKTVLICAGAALLAACAMAPPSLRSAQQSKPDEVVADLLRKGNCDDAWFFAVRSGSQQLIDRVDSACRLKPADVVGDRPAR